MRVNVFYFIFGCLTFLAGPTIGMGQTPGTCPTDGPFYCSYHYESATNSLSFFGRKVAVDNNILIVGSHQETVELVNFDSGTFLHQLVDPDIGNVDNAFGYSVDIKGSIAIVGDSQHDSSLIQNLTKHGQAFIFKLDLQALHGGSGPVVTDTISLPDPTDDGNGEGEFGHDVAVSANYALVGEPKQSASVGGAHLFQNLDGTKIRSFNYPAPNPGDHFGSYVAIEEFGGDVFVAISAHLDDNILDENLMRIGTSVNCGRVYLYNQLSDSPIHSFPNPGDFDPGEMADLKFGQDSDIKNGRLVVAYSDGAISYDLTAPGFPMIQKYEPNSGIEPTRQFYMSNTCGISDDKVVLGILSNNLKGRMYVYDIVGDGNPIQTIADPKLSTTDIVPTADILEEWPISIAIDDKNIAVGTSLQTVPGSFYHGGVDMFRDPLLGDTNFDGVVNSLDISNFVQHVLSGEYLLEADINLDLVVNSADERPFMDLLN